MTRRRLALLVVAGVVTLFGFAIGARLRGARDVRSSSTEEFVLTDVPPRRAVANEPAVVWPMYGFNQERTRAADFDHRPPFRRLWTFGARALVEFPPVIAYGRLYFTNANGRIYAVNARTGRRAWKFDAGRCAAASPAVHDHLVFQTFLQGPRCENRAKRGSGEVVALYAGFGQLLWRRRIGPSETSPLVSEGTVYIGDSTGRIYALDARTGRTRWSRKTGSAVKGGLALSSGRLFVGSYDHHLYAFDARTGALRWRSRVQSRFGSPGRFYSMPALAYGRVYIGGTDGRIYSYGATTGKLRWSHQTGGYVYSSPAVWRRRVYAGSYDGNLYSLDAATGDLVWKFAAGAPISGSATVVGRIVYFSTLARRTYGLDARTGRRLWTFADGEYTPTVADSERIYVVGRAKLYAFAGR
jgi:outer membrane protein assembly factor BamB